MSLPSSKKKNKLIVLNTFAVCLFVSAKSSHLKNILHTIFFFWRNKNEHALNIVVMEEKNKCFFSKFLLIMNIV